MHYYTVYMGIIYRLAFHYLLALCTQTEAPILIKPFLGKMTNSELHAVMTGGFATIAGEKLLKYLDHRVG